MGRGVHFLFHYPWQKSFNNFLLTLELVVGLNHLEGIISPKYSKAIVLAETSLLDQALLTLPIN